MPTEKAKPAATLRDGSLQASIWKNTSENGTFYSTTITRSYQTEDGDYKNTNSYSGTELLKLSRLAAKAYDRELELKAADREAAKAKEVETGFEQ